MASEPNSAYKKLFSQEKQYQPDHAFLVARLALSNKKGERSERRRRKPQRVKQFRAPQKPHERKCARPLVAVGERMVLNDKI